ncbi:unnamed protein product [Closterium sp. NIES-53]
MAPGQQASAKGMAVEEAEDKGEADLAATTSLEAAGVADMATTTRAMDAVAADSMASATIVTRADICGAIASSSLMDGPLLKAKRVEEQVEGEKEAVEAVEVAEVVLQQRQGLHVPAAEEEGRGKRRIQAPNRLTYEALGKPAKSALAGAALMVGEDEESDYEECAFAFFSPVEMPGEPATLKEALESSDAEEWKKAMESELKSIDENGTWELVELPEGRKAITSKWLFKIKSDVDGKIEHYKSRLVAKGYQQKEKVD